ncbi:HAMP domain-containing protein [Bacillus coahuilensis]|uniref:HAMP domain-containing protein n=1 Tax=Bacillus coahuilensis TaxID=408580 RepID=UPI0002DCBEAC|nr:HAMP domain-containing protein [Bacillus coahuilensis]
MRKLAGKLLLLLLGMLLVTILVSFTLTGFLYERLYVNSIKEELVQYGENVSLDYDGGDVSDIFVWNVEYLNEKTRFEIFAVRNPRELSACVPFEIDYNALIGSKERAQLLDGQSVIDVGYEERFKRDLVSVVVPLLDEDRLEGILYLYYPLENIQELTENYALLWVLCIFLFSMIISVIGAKGVSYVINPLLEMKDAAKNISRGDLTSRVNVSSRDEIGELAETFNKMAESLEKEDERNKEFLATVSHELRTPITYIKGYNEALQMNLGTEIERAQYFQLIRVKLLD